jgi:prepilin-type N-terminal cleavage/methylation domain-containing protein
MKRFSEIINIPGFGNQIMEKYFSKMAGDRGFSLLELMVALGILSIGFLFLSGLSVSILRTNKLSQNKTAALQLAQEKIETMKSLSLSELQGGTEAGLKTGTLKTSFQRETIVQKEEGASLARITVRVCWPSHSNPGCFHSLQLSTQMVN